MSEWPRRWPALCLLVSAAPAIAAPGVAAPPGLPTLLHDIEALRNEYRIPSVALTLVSTQDVLWTGALGYADNASRKPATADTLYRIGSITKAFTSLAILLAVEDQRLSLEDPVTALAPDAPLTNPWSATDPVRVAHLLEHTAGLLDLGHAEFYHSDPKPLSLQEALAVEPDARVCLWPPGLHSSYSNAGAGLAAYALERATGQRFEDYVTSRLFRPLGMQQAGFFLDAPTQANLATGYDRDGKTVIPYWHTLFRAFGGINATAREMAGLVHLLLNRGEVAGKRLLSEAAIERMETPRTTLAARSGLNYGYGLGNYQFVYAGFLWHGHGGDGDGYLSRFAYSRQLGLGYFVVINAFHQRALREICARIQDYLIQGHTPTTPPLAQMDPARLEALTGRYEAVTHRFPRDTPAAEAEPDRLEVVLSDSRLFTRTPDGERRELLPLDERHFRRAQQPVATIAFIEYRGELYLQGEPGNYRRVVEPARLSED